jgi:hypothetical protein
MSALAFAAGTSLPLTSRNLPRRRFCVRRRDRACATEAPATQAVVPAATDPAVRVSAAASMGCRKFAKAVAGEWFGYEVSFAVNDGSPLSIPERYIPDEFSQWGVQVLGFEEVTSSRVFGADGKSGGGGDGEGSHLYLKRTRALPIVGCEADAVVPECRYERFVAGASADVSVSEYGVKGTVVTGAAVGFDDGAWSAGPPAFDQDAFGRWYACIVDPAAEARRARLEFSTVNEPRGAVVAFVETNEGPFCDGELLPGCGGKNSSFAEQPALTAAELSGSWEVETTVYTSEGTDTSETGEHVVSGWFVSRSFSVVVRSEEQVQTEVNVFMPTGLSVGMVKSDGEEMEFRAGWLTSPSRRVVVSRLYGAHGKLVSISRSAEKKIDA